MQRNRAFTSGCDRIDSKFRTCIDITAYKNIRFGSLVSQFVGKCAAVRAKFHMEIVQHMAPVDCLSYGKDHMTTRHCHCIILIIFR